MRKNRTTIEKYNGRLYVKLEIHNIDYCLAFYTKYIISIASCGRMKFRFEWCDNVFVVLCCVIHIIMHRITFSNSFHLFETGTHSNSTCRNTKILSATTKTINRFNVAKFFYHKQTYATHKHTHTYIKR